MFAETTIPAMWKPTFRLSETSLIMLEGLCLVMMSFVQPLPHKRCEAGLTNGVNASTFFKAELYQIKSGFLSPDYWCNTVWNIHNEDLVHISLYLDMANIFYDYRKYHILLCVYLQYKISYISV